MKVLHIHKITGISGSERHLLTLLPALRERGVDARFLGLDVPGSDAPRFYAALDDAGVPFEQRALHGGREPADGRRRGQGRPATRPDLLHTHLVHGDIYGAIASPLLRFPSYRLATTTTGTCSVRFVTSIGCSRAARARSSRSPMQCACSSSRQGSHAGKLVTVHYGLDALPDAPSELTPEELGIADDAPLLLAIGRLIAQKDHATLLRAFARGTRRIIRVPCSRSSAAALSRPRHARWCGELGLDGAVTCRGGSRFVTGSTGPTCSSTRPAGRASASCCSRRCWPGFRSSQRGSAPFPRSS